MQSCFPAIVHVDVVGRLWVGVRLLVASRRSSSRYNGEIGGPKHLHGGHHGAKPHDAPCCALELHIFIFRGASRTSVSQFVSMIADGSSCY